MKTFTTLLLGLCTFFSLAQTDQEILFNLQQEARALEQLAQSDDLDHSTQSTRTRIADADDDGMPDAWETANGLDPNDKSDAWLDLDADNIINLFEYQMDWDPNLSDAHLVIDISPDVREAEIQAVMMRADGGKAYIRFSEGTYDLTLLGLYNNSYRLFIQGGWSEDFQTYHPDLHKTIFTSSDEALIIGPRVSGLAFATVIVQGLHVINSGSFELAGGVQVFGMAKESTLSLLDCSFRDNRFYGVGYSSRDFCEESYLYMINCDVLNNAKGGVYAQVGDDAQSKWKIINTTIHNPTSSEGGVDGIILGDASLEIDCINSIVWGNATYSFNFYSFEEIDITADYSNIDAVRPGVAGLSIITLTNSINQNPLFVDAAAGDVRLNSTSPCIDNGIDVGLPYIGASPDLGSNEFGMSGVFNTPKQEIGQIDFVPNIITAGRRHVTVKDLEKSLSEVYIIDMTGRTISLDDSQVGQNKFTLANDLSSGRYMVMVKETSGKVLQGQILIAE